MKKEMFNQSLQFMQELPVESCEMIYGGESLWYWIAYGVGSFLSGVNRSQSAGQHLYNSALG